MAPGATNRSDRLAQDLARRCELERLVASISRSFVGIDSAELNEALDRTLADIGAFVQADRSYMCRFDPERGLMSNTHEWCAEGIDSQSHVLQDLPVKAFPWSHDRLMNERYIDIALVADLPAEASAEKEILREQGVQSILAVGLHSRTGALRGFVGFDAVREVRPWRPDDLHLLTVISDLIAAAIEHDELIGRLTESERWQRTTIEDLRELALELTSAEEVQRRELALQLHDGIGQELTAVNLLLQALRKRMGLPDAVLNQTIGILQETMRKTQDLTFDMSPTVLYELGLGPALSELARRYSLPDGPSIEVDIADPESTRPIAASVLLFRIARELLFNALKHAQAKRIILRLVCRHNMTRLIVADDGLGMAADTELRIRERQHDGFGLFSIRQRIEPLGGHMEITTASGTVVEISLPGCTGLPARIRSEST
jgi:signal transduction histidine kinase